MEKEKDILFLGIKELILHIKEFHTCIMHCIGIGSYTLVYLSNGDKVHVSSNMGVVAYTFRNKSLLRNERNMLVNIRFIKEVDFFNFKITMKNKQVFNMSDKAKRLLIKCKKQNIFKLNFKLVRKSELLIDRYIYVPRVRRILWIYGEKKRKIKWNAYD